MSREFPFLKKSFRGSNQKLTVFKASRGNNSNIVSRREVESDDEMDMDELNLSELPKAQMANEVIQN